MEALTPAETRPALGGLLQTYAQSPNSIPEFSQRRRNLAIQTAGRLEDGRRVVNEVIGKRQRQLPNAGTSAYLERYRTEGYLSPAKAFDPNDQNVLIITTSVDNHTLMADMDRSFFATVKGHGEKLVKWEIYDCSHLFRSLEPKVKVWQYSLSGKYN